MGFLAPWMLWGVLAAGIPVVLHLFYRSRYRTVPWAAMKFLLTSVEQTSRRLRFQELLLLIARTAVLLFLALALARPSSLTRNGASEGEAVDAVFLMDVSYSMAAKDGPVTRFERAKAAALAVIDHLPPHSTVQIVSSADRASYLGPVAASNLDQARAILQSLELTHLSTDFLPGVAEAEGALAKGHSANKELYLFSDMQRTGWDRQAAPLVEKLKGVREKAAVYLVRCGTREPLNVAVVGIASQSGIPHTGERAGFAVLVRNSGTEPARDLTVSLEVDGNSRERETQSIAVLAPGETQAVTLTGRLDRAGFRVLTAAVAHDELESDNRYPRVLRVRDQARALVVDGSPGDLRPESWGAFYLLHTLRPVPEAAWGAYHIQPRVVTPAEASPALLADVDLCILANAGVQSGSAPGALPADFVERLSGFVREGNGLLVFAGPKTTPDAYNRFLLEEGGLLPARLLALEDAPPASPLRIDAASIEPASYLAGFREEPLNRVGQTNVLHYAALGDLAGDARVELRFANGRPAVAARRVGAGRVVFVATSAEPRWSDWPLRHTFLPFVHVTLSHLLGGESENYNRSAGEPLQWHPTALEGSKVYVVHDPAGRRSRLGVPERVDGRPVVTVGDTPRAGIYRILPDGVDPEKAADPVLFAAAPDVRESENLDALSDRQLDERLGFRVYHLTAGDDASVFAGAERLKREWTLWILAAVLLLVLAEAALAWYCGRGL